VDITKTPSLVFDNVLALKAHNDETASKKPARNWRRKTPSKMTMIHQITE
jgi:hypothetical protein